MTCYLHNLFYSHRSSLTGLLMTRVRVRRWAVTVICHLHHIYVFIYNFIFECVVIELLVWLLICCVLIELLCGYWTNKKKKLNIIIFILILACLVICHLHHIYVFIYNFIFECVVIELLVWLLIFCVLIELLCGYWTNKENILGLDERCPTS